MRVPFKIDDDLLMRVRRITARGFRMPEIARYLGIADRTLHHQGRDNLIARDSRTLDRREVLGVVGAD